MKVFEIFCFECETILGCKFYNRAGTLIRWECRTCLIKAFNDICFLSDQDNYIERTDTMCDSCLYKVIKEMEERRRVFKNDRKKKEISGGANGAEA